VAAVDPTAYKEVLIVLGAAGVVIPLFRRLGVSSVLGFLLTGILIGPSVLGTFAADYPLLRFFSIEGHENIEAPAELGVVFLLFMIGIELSFERLMTMRRLVFGLGTAQIIASSLAIAVIVYLLGARPAEAAIAGAALSLSSTAIVIQLLSDEKRLNTSTGRRCFAILLMQDLAVVPILLLVDILGARSEGSIVFGVLLALSQAAVAIIAIVLVGRYLLRPLLRLVAQTRSADLFMAATLLIAVGAGLSASVAGLSMAMGAFIAGLLLAETEFRREIEAIIEPFKGLMLGAFFMLVGMGINLAEVAANPIIIISLAAGLIALKAAIVVIAGMALKLKPAGMFESALMLGPGGEFAFVILAAAGAHGLLSAAVNQTALIVVSISMLAIPLFARLGTTVTKTLVSSGTLPPEALVAPPEDHAGRVIVVGYGRVGKLLADMLEENGIPYLAVESDPEIVARAHRAGKPIYYGDASRPAFLRKCDIAHAKALAITINAPSKVDDVLSAARRERADLKIVARARDEKHAVALYEMGATEAVPETIEAALQLGEAVLVESGVAIGLAIASVHERRDGFRKLLGRPNRREEFRIKRLRRARHAGRSATET
jgi:monovalent cation:proton antiporter-2 (CPA2) family protein